jgi:hypothetical protein
VTLRSVTPEIPRLLRSSARESEGIQMPVVETYRKKLRGFNEIAEAITATNPSVRVFDQNVLFCNEASRSRRTARPSRGTNSGTCPNTGAVR